MMLSPEKRELLTDALRPSAGCRVDLAIATTYSLDLVALLTAPLSFAAADHAEQSGEQIDPVRLLQAARRHANRTTVFCQAAAVHLPGKFRSLFTFTEEMVVECRPHRTDHAFHPKIWLLRFTDTAGRYRHRFICLSRNLTFDQSWDTLLRLDEPTEHSSTEHPDTAPLADFVEHLPDLAIHPVSPKRRTQARALAESVSRARFAPPIGVDAVTFLPIGHRPHDPPAWPFPRHADQIIALSPFLSAGTLQRLSRVAGTGKVVSRPETFDRIGAAGIPDNLEPHVLRRDIEVPDGQDTERPSDSAGNDPPEGLHAKTFILDTSNDGVIITGSANATTAAFAGNVEFAVALRGPIAGCGAAAAWTSARGVPGLDRITELYTPGDVGDADPREDTDHQIDTFHADLAAEGLVLTVSEQAPQQYHVTLRPPNRQSPGQTSVWPLSLPSETYATPLTAKHPPSWAPLLPHTLTAYLAIRTTAGNGPARSTRATVLKATLHGDLPDRGQAVLRDILSNRRDVARYLLMLLADPTADDIATHLTAADDAAQDSNTAAFFDGSTALFEPLIRASARGGETLDQVQELVDDLSTRPDRDDLLPPGFPALWEAIRQARSRERR